MFLEKKSASLFRNGNLYLLVMEPLVNDDPVVFDLYQRQIVSKIFAQVTPLDQRLFSGFRYRLHPGLRYSYASPSRSSPSARLARKLIPSKMATNLERRSTISFSLPSLSSSLKSAPSMTPFRSFSSANRPMMILILSPISLSPYILPYLQMNRLQEPR